MTLDWALQEDESGKRKERRFCKEKRFTQAQPHSLSQMIQELRVSPKVDKSWGQQS